jgi:MFS family permease
MTPIPNEHNGIGLEGEHEAVGNRSMDSEKTIEAENSDHNAHGEDKPVDVPPDGGYGWVCTGCCFVINAHTWGVNSVCFSLIICIFNLLILA